MSQSHHSPWLVALSLMAVAAAACSTSTPAASPTTAAHRSTADSRSTAPTTRADAAARYAAIIKPVDAALIAFRSQAAGWSSSLTNSQAMAEAQPAMTAMTTASAQLLALAQLYAPASADLKAEVAGMSAVSGDLGGLATVNLLDASSWQSQLSHDDGVMAGAAATVRSDLGLPPAG